MSDYRMDYGKSKDKTSTNDSDCYKRNKYGKCISKDEAVLTLWLGIGFLILGIIIAVAYITYRCVKRNRLRAAARAAGPGIPGMQPPGPAGMQMQGQPGGVGMVPPGPVQMQGQPGGVGMVPPGPVQMQGQPQGPPGPYQGQPYQGSPAGYPQMAQGYAPLPSAPPQTTSKS